MKTKILVFSIVKENQNYIKMEGVIVKSEVLPKSNFKPKTQIQLPKVVLGAGRNMAEIDYDAVFENEIKI